MPEAPEATESPQSREAPELAGRPENLWGRVAGKYNTAISDACPSEKVSETPSGQLFALDATLGVPGLPQSGTGQTTLLTGLNAAVHLGEHRGPYPGSELRALLAQQAIFRDLREAGRRSTLANAYPERYLERARAGKGRMGAFARSTQLCGLSLRGPDELREGRAVSAFLHNRGWREHLGYEGMPRLDEAEAGANLARLSLDHDLTVFEYYATDVAGHHPERIDPVDALEALDRFLSGLLQDLEHQDDVQVLLASDHGNIEDESSKRHSTNPALGALWSPKPPEDLRLTSLMDVAPLIRSLLV